MIYNSNVHSTYTIFLILGSSETFLQGRHQIPDRNDEEGLHWRVRDR